MVAHPDVCVIAVVPDHWNGVWGVRHQVLSRLSRYYRVLWVPPAPGWRAAWTGKANSGATSAELPDGLSVFSYPRRYPEFFRPGWLADFMRRKQVAGIVAQARATGCKKFVLYLWRPEYAGMLELIPHELSLYHIDDEYSFSDTEVPLDPAEAQLIQAVDRVFIHSPGLLEKKGHLNPHTEFIPNGVNFAAYAESVAEPADLAGIPGPRIAYVGVIKKQLDLKLLRDLAVARPDWSWILVGPVGNVSGKEQWLTELELCSNVFLLGGKAADELPGYVQHVDVCTMSYAATAYTQYIYPLKLHEYLAAGKPVVSTPIRTVQAFGSVVDFAESAAEWLSAIEKNLAPEADTAGRRSARQAIAREHDWERAVDKIVAQIYAGLEV